MTRRLIVLVAALVAVFVLYMVVLRVAPPPKSWTERMASRAQASEGPADFEKPGPYPTEYDEVTVTIEIPPVSEFPAGWAESDGCPHSRVSGALGASIGPGNGCPVLALEPDGPAAKAGIQRFDRLGEPSDCASTLYYKFKPRKEARTIEWTVRRPKATGSEASQAGGPEAEASGGKG